MGAAVKEAKNGFPPQIAVSGGASNDVQGGSDSQIGGLLNVFQEVDSSLGFNCKKAKRKRLLKPRQETPSRKTFIKPAI